uniref:(northern house mosquito) hypothetical protein n=1 Tax=Culex pipiens TaxID=7175 RepID=A0A8D8FJ03_CULPI
MERKRKLHLESESGLNADFASWLNHQMAPCGDAFLAYNLKGCKLGLALGCLEKGLSRQSTGRARYRTYCTDCIHSCVFPSNAPQNKILAEEDCCKKWNDSIFFNCLWFDANI